jgi:hypothetical protein
MAIERQFKAGKESSEFQMTQLAHLLGVGVLAIGVLITIYGAVYVLWPVVLGGVGLAYVGGEILEKTVSAYSRSRGAVKASAMAPPTTVVSPSVKVGAGRL